MKTIVLFLSVLTVILAHSYLTAPTPRQKHYGCRIGGPPEFPVNCPGPCEVPKSSVNRNRIIQTSRGSRISVEWPRNNHGGGFIRLAWAKLEDSDDHQAFTRGVSQISCHETGYMGDPANTSPNRGCASDDPRNPMGGDTGSAEGNNPNTGADRACMLLYTIPSWLTDGVWTMQWAWYGASGGYLGDYYSCSDFNVAGGAAVTAQVNPVFKGGDVNNIGQQACSFSTADRPHYCWSEPCMEIYNSSFSFDKYKIQSGAPYLPTTVNVPTVAPTSEQPPAATSRPPINVDDLPEIKVSITVSLNLAPKLVDTTVFVYEVAKNLNIPTSAIPDVVLDLDQSTATTTIVQFKLQNVQLPDGTRVDPVAAAYRLRDLTTDPNSSLKSSAFLSTMEVVSVEEPQDDNVPFVQTGAFIIIVSVVGGVVVLGITAAVVIVILKKRRSGGFF